MDRLIKKVNVIQLADALARKQTASDLLGYNEFGEIANEHELYDSEGRYTEFAQSHYDGYYDFFMDIIYECIEL